MKGTFITFEGCEGVGKSTQLRLLKEYLDKSGQHAVFTREPGGTPVAEKIRELLLSTDYKLPAPVEAYLFAAARADHMENLILPELEKGSIVICDRFIDSSLAYQGAARGLGYETVLEINSRALFGRQPDCTVFLDMDPAVSWRKQKGKIIEGDRMEMEDAAFHHKVYLGYKEIARIYPRIISIAPDKDKNVTNGKIVGALKGRGIIK
jgi:thymidylate kinase